jgi:general secretion pathway protein C
MSVDAIARRYFFAITGTMVASAAYLQSSGIGQLVAAHLAPSEVTPPPRIAAAITPKLGDKSASPILTRNAFDSVTGPLEGGTVQAAEVKPAAVRSGGDPYKDPPCSGIKSSLVTAAEDPAWSFANLSSPEGKSQLRRAGDKVGSATVFHIGWMESTDPDFTARVWLLEGSARCLVEMGGAEKSKPAGRGGDPAPSSKSGAKQKLTAEIEQKIKKVGDNQYIVEKSGVEQIIQNYARLAGSLRTRNTKEGMRLSGIKPNDIMSKLGMKNGDLLQSINGFDMSDPDKAVDAYAKLRSAGKLAITVNRDGAPFTIDIQIQ